MRSHMVITKNGYTFSLRAYYSVSIYPTLPHVIFHPWRHLCLVTPIKSPPGWGQNLSHTLLSTVPRKVFNKFLTNKHYPLSRFPLSFHYKIEKNSKAVNKLKKSFPSITEFGVDHKTGGNTAHTKYTVFIILLLSNPGIEPGSSTLQADSLPTELSGKPIILLIIYYKMQAKFKYSRTHFLQRKAVQL